MRYVQLLAEITGRPLRVARISDVWVGPALPRTVVMPLRDLDRLLSELELETARPAQ